MRTVRGWTEAELRTREKVFDGLIAKAVRMALRPLTLDVSQVVTAAGEPPSISQVASMIGPTVSMSGGNVTVAWENFVDQELFPYLTQTFLDSALETLTGMESALDGSIPKITDSYAQAYLSTAKNRLVGIGDLVWTAIRTQLEQGVEAGESMTQLAARVRNVSKVTAPRAATIARTEVHAAAEQGSLAQVQVAGFSDAECKKGWLATEDERTRIAHYQADGQKVGINQPFIVGGEGLQFPGDPNGSPGNTINCRCSMEFIFTDDAEFMTSAHTFHLGDEHNQKSHGRRGVDADTSGKKPFFHVLPKAERGKSGDGRYHKDISGMWGKYGAAGIMMRHVDDEGTARYMVVQRVGGKGSGAGGWRWQLPGGALEEKETDAQGAAREVTEELGFPESYLAKLEPRGVHRVELPVPDMDPWHYSNMTADVPYMLKPKIDFNELGAARWLTEEQLREMMTRGRLVKPFHDNFDKILAQFDQPLTAAKKNPDWDPLEHPKGPDGRFIKKGATGYGIGKLKLKTGVDKPSDAVVNMELNELHKKSNLAYLKGDDKLAEEINAEIEDLVAYLDKPDAATADLDAEYKKVATELSKKQTAKNVAFLGGDDYLTAILAAEIEDLGNQLDEIENKIMAAHKIPQLSKTQLKNVADNTKGMNKPQGTPIKAWTKTIYNKTYDSGGVVATKLLDDGKRVDILWMGKEFEEWEYDPATGSGKKLDTYGKGKLYAKVKKETGWLEPVPFDAGVTVTPITDYDFDDPNTGLDDDMAMTISPSKYTAATIADNLKKSPTYATMMTSGAFNDWFDIVIKGVPGTWEILTEEDKQAVAEKATLISDNYPEPLQWINAHTSVTPTSGVNLSNAYTLLSPDKVEKSEYLTKLGELSKGEFEDWVNNSGIHLMMQKVDGNIQDEIWQIAMDKGQENYLAAMLGIDTPSDLDAAPGSDVIGSVSIPDNMNKAQFLKWFDDTFTSWGLTEGAKKWHTLSPTEKAKVKATAKLVGAPAIVHSIDFLESESSISITPHATPPTPAPANLDPKSKLHLAAVAAVEKYTLSAPSTGPHDYKSVTPAGMSAIQANMFTESGVNWNDKQKAAINAYTNKVGYQTVNAVLRHDTKRMNMFNDSQLEDAVKRADVMQSAMLPLTEDVQLYRGVNAEQFGFATGKVSLAKLKALEGKTIQDNGFHSTTVVKKPTVAFDYANKKSIRVVVNAPKGTPGLWVSSATSWTQENEFILAAGTNFKIDSVVAATDDDKKNFGSSLEQIVTVTVVPGKKAQPKVEAGAPTPAVPTPNAPTPVPSVVPKSFFEDPTNLSVMTYSEKTNFFKNLTPEKWNSYTIQERAAIQDVANDLSNPSLAGYAQSILVSMPKTPAAPVSSVVSTAKSWFNDPMNVQSMTHAETAQFVQTLTPNIYVTYTQSEKQSLFNAVNKIAPEMIGDLEKIAFPVTPPDDVPTISPTPAAPALKWFPIKLNTATIHKAQYDHGQVVAVNSDGSKRIYWNGVGKKFNIETKDPNFDKWSFTKAYTKKGLYDSNEKDESSWFAPSSSTKLNALTLDETQNLKPSQSSPLKLFTPAPPAPPPLPPQKKGYWYKGKLTSSMITKAGGYDVGQIVAARPVPGAPNLKERIYWSGKHYVFQSQASESSDSWVTTKSLTKKDTAAAVKGLAWYAVSVNVKLNVQDPDLNPKPSQIDFSTPFGFGSNQPFTPNFSGSSAGVTSAPDTVFNIEQLMGDISTVLPAAAKKVFDIYKNGAGVGIGKPFASSNGEKKFKILVAATHEINGTLPEGKKLNNLQVLKLVDQESAKVAGVPNQGLYTASVIEWLKTPEGKKYAPEIIANSMNPSALANLGKTVMATPSAPSPSAGIKPDVQAVLDTMKPAYSIGTPKTGITSFPNITVGDATAMQAEMHKLGGKWTAQQKASIKNYTGSGSTSINTMLYSPNSTWGGTGTAQQIVDIQAAMLPMTKSFTLHRATNSLGKQFDNYTLADWQNLVGKTIEHPSFLGGSVGNFSAFDGKTLDIRVQVPEGTPGVYVDNISQHKGERELLLAGGLKYEVLSVSSTGQTYGKKFIINLRVVPA